MRDGNRGAVSRTTRPLRKAVNNRIEVISYFRLVFETFEWCYNYNYNYNRDMLCAPYKQNDGALHCHDVLTLKAVLNKKVLRRLLNVSIEHVVVSLRMLTIPFSAK